MFIYGFGVLLLACVFQGSFGICFKKYQPFSWEAFWALFSIIGVLLIPHIWAYIEVPSYMKYILQTPVHVLLIGALAGFFWGISAIWYSRAIDTIGVSLTSGINIGASTILGSLIPMLILKTVPAANVLTVLLIGQVIMLLGVAALTKAGLMKGSVDSADKGLSSAMKSGIILALISGLGSASLNIAYSYTQVPVQNAIADGIPAISASLISWPVVFFGGFLANFFYALSNNGIALVIANAWGLKDGEWKGYPEAKKVMFIGNGILIISFIVLGIANGM
ncbi:L-rhamnose/proton symporter RhaT [Sebaldella sp. S0638]|uniref:L-rhamnose/proton symporter RhaT n=1 Tax=Sebaldella sp. S0638 TaxID=2957809 RepID=UPI0020A1F67C|nr:L-rhamnose/proton symporter RhaT [Sebaldella sp. S0638]MCP1225832.1 rhamnose/proton symporter RhaT [Sebaldella sp. S0638]